MSEKKSNQASSKPKPKPPTGRLVKGLQPNPKVKSSSGKTPKKK